MMHLYIPSRGRVGTLRERTLAQIPKLYYEHTTIVVPKDEVDKYAYAGFDIMSAPEGIAATRQAIGKDAMKNGFGTFMMLDDDLKFFQRKAADDFHLLPTTEDDRVCMFQAVEQALHYYAHVAISSREGNNRFGVGEAPLIQESTRALRALAFRTVEFNQCEHGRVDVMEDFDIQLQLLRRNMPNAVLAYWAHDQQMTNAKGGCSIYRTHELHERSARMLAELHPDFVKLRQKANKTDKSGFGSRTEVTVYWKKALGCIR